MDLIKRLRDKTKIINLKSASPEDLKQIANCFLIPNKEIKLSEEVEKKIEEEINTFAFNR